MRRILIALGVLTAIGFGIVALWRRNPRMGTRVMNERVNPFLVERGIAGLGRSEIGTIEHYGRTSGTRYLTPVHPEPIENGFRIMVPLGLQSHWARNVMAAGHCRMQLHDMVYELDEPEMLLPRAMAELAAVPRAIGGSLGFTYLRLHTFAERPGSLDAAMPAEAASPATPLAPAAEQVATPAPAAS